MIKECLNRLIKRSFFLSACKQVWFCRKWRKRNTHNFTVAKNCFHAESVTVGMGTYGELNIVQFGNPDERIEIGNYCSIAPQCSFLLGGEHPYERISTYPFKTKYGMVPYESTSKGPIIVEDDVWIGYGSMILSGVHIGQGAVIAAGSVVTKDVPAYAIVGGVPAKVIKYRFSPEIREALMKVDYGKLNKDIIKSHIDDLYQELTNVEQLNWLT